MSFTAASGPKTLGAANDALTLDCSEYQTVAIQFVSNASFAGTVSYEQSLDGTTWVLFGMQDLTSATASIATTKVNPVAQAYYGPVPLKFFRVRVSAYTSGSIGVIGCGTDTATTTLF